VTLDGGITQVARDFLIESIAEAQALKAQALIIQLDTPGGLLQATRDIVAAFLNSEVPIVVWVGPSGARAGSAGVFITMAAHVAAMAPGTNIGAAHPVSAMGKDIEGDMAKKVTNDTVAWARSIAQLRGRNAEWAAEAVRESASIPEREALSKNVIDFVARDEDGLIQALDGRLIELPKRSVRLSTSSVVVMPYAMSPRQKLVQFLANPNLAYILLLVGLFGLFLEFKAPGLMVPGVVGATCIALVLGVQIMPVNWLGVLLIAAATICLVAEVFVPSFGILTIVGLGSLVLGSFLLFDVPESDFRVEPSLIWAGAGGFGVLALTLGSLLMRSMRAGPTTGKESMIGEVGTVVRPIGIERPGRVDLRSTTWLAVADERILEQTLVRVVKVEGITLQVVRHGEAGTPDDHKEIEEVS
jgi:membrane-bound serine protease (ClpP class)